MSLYIHSQPETVFSSSEDSSLVTVSNFVQTIFYEEASTRIKNPQIRAQSLFLALGALVLPDVNF